MSKTIAFSGRNFKELVRDPLSYIFCLGFPLVMLVVMTLVNDSIPKETNMTIFRIDNLAGGIAVFGLTFVMLFVCLTVAKDRSGAFLMRLYSTPSEYTPIGFMVDPFCRRAVVAREKSRSCVFSPMPPDRPMTTSRAPFLVT